MAKILKAIAPENPIQPNLADSRFKPHEFGTIEELWAARTGWVPPSKRAHLKARATGEKAPRLVGRIGLGGKFEPEDQ